ncbi:hypothetical protein EON65_28635 [archaeon]|nr:MAG: hypothetical protein EON65_28635 [archaeon]
MSDLAAKSTDHRTCLNAARSASCRLFWNCCCATDPILARPLRLGKGGDVAEPPVERVDAGRSKYGCNTLLEWFADRRCGGGFSSLI